MNGMLQTIEFVTQFPKESTEEYSVSDRQMLISLKSYIFLTI